MITAKGIGFLAAAIVLFLLASLTQVGWLYLVDAVLWGLIFLSAICPWVATAFLAAQRSVEHSASTSDSPGPAEGDQIQITLTLRNRGLWPIYVLGLFYDCTVAAPDHRILRFFVTQVTRSGQVSMVSTIRAYQRGMHHLGPVVAESSAPFGLFRRRARLTGSEPVLVFPQVYPLQRLALAECLSGTVSGARKSRTGTDQVGSRQYLQGDPRRLIHWRNTARTGRIMVRELEDSVDRTLHLLFDATRVWGEGRETTLEYGIKVVASIAHYAHRNQIPVRVLGGGLDCDRETPGKRGTWPNQTAWSQIFKALASVTRGDGRGLAETLAHVPHGGSVVVVVSSADRTGLQAILKASLMLHQLVVILLEGFGEDGMDDGHLRALQTASTQMVICRPGQLREALQSFETRGRPISSAIGRWITQGSGGRVPKGAGYLENNSCASTCSVGADGAPKGYDNSAGEEPHR